MDSLPEDHSGSGQAPATEQPSAIIGTTAAGQAPATAGEAAATAGKAPATAVAAAATAAAEEDFTASPRMPAEENDTKGHVNAVDANLSPPVETAPALPAAAADAAPAPAAAAVSRSPPRSTSPEAAAAPPPPPAATSPPAAVGRASDSGTGGSYSRPPGVVVHPKMVLKMKIPRRSSTPPDSAPAAAAGGEGGSSSAPAEAEIGGQMAVAAAPGDAAAAGARSVGLDLSGPRPHAPLKPRQIGPPPKAPPPPVATTAAAPPAKGPATAAVTSPKPIAAAAPPSKGAGTAAAVTSPKLAAAAPPAKGAATAAAVTPLKPPPAAGAPSSSSSPNKKSPMNEEQQLEKLGSYIASLGGKLEEGWKVQGKLRATGASAGSIDYIYINPAGKKFRTRALVAAAHGLEPPQSGSKAKEKAGDGAGDARGATGDGGKAPGAGGVSSSPGKGGAAGGAAAGGWRSKRASSLGALKAVAAAAAAGERGDDGDGGDVYAPSAKEAQGHQLEKPAKKEVKIEPLLSREEAVAKAKDLAADLAAKGVGVPLRLSNGVVVESIGQIDKRPSFCTQTNIWPVGFRATYKDPNTGTYVSEIGKEAGQSRAGFTVSFVLKQRRRTGEGADAQEGEETAGGADSAAEGDAEVEGGESKGAVAAAAAGNGGAGAAANGGNGRGDEDGGPPLKLTSARSPDAAWSAVAALQTKAKAAAAGGQAALEAGAKEAGVPLAAFIALSKGVSLKGVWGRGYFGMADVRVLQLIEGLEGAEDCTNYLFVNQRGGWGQEEVILSQGKWAKRSVIAGSIKGITGGVAAAATAAGGGSGGGAAAAAEGVAGSPGGKGSGSAKKRAPVEAVQRDPKRFKGMSEEDRQVAEAVEKVMDKILLKMDKWEVVEASKARKKEEASAAKAATKAAKQSTKDAAHKKDPKVLAKQALAKAFPGAKLDQQGGGGGVLAGLGAALQGALAARAGSLAAAVAAGGGQQQLLVEDMELPGAASMQLPVARPALECLRGEQAGALMQAWEFCCRFGEVLGLEQSPDLREMEQGVLGVVSHLGTAAAEVAARKQAEGVTGAAGVTDRPAGGPVSLVDGGGERVGGSRGGSPSPAAAAGAVAGKAEEAAAAVVADAGAVAAGRSWVDLHVALVELLVADAFGAVAASEMRDMKPAEIRAGTPKVSSRESRTAI